MLELKRPLDLPWCLCHLYPLTLSPSYEVRSSHLINFKISKQQILDEPGGWRSVICCFWNLTEISNLQSKLHLMAPRHLPTWAAPSRACATFPTQKKRKHGNPGYSTILQINKPPVVGKAASKGFDRLPALTLSWTCWDMLSAQRRAASVCPGRAPYIANHCNTLHVEWGGDSGKVTLHALFGNHGLYDNGNVWNVRASKQHLLLI